MNILAKTDDANFEKRGQAPGEAVVVKSVEGSEEEFTRETEFFQLPGFASCPTKGDRLILVPIEGGYEVIVASHNYQIGVSVQKGEVKIFATDSTGLIKRAEIYLKNNAKEIEIDGNLTIKGNLTVESQATFKQDTIFDKDLIVTGDVIATGEVFGNGIQLSTHTHNYTDTPIGPSVTQSPNP